MNKYIVSVAWSQTDHENVLVDAETSDEAEQKVKKALPMIHHITGCRIIHHMVIG